MDDQSNDPRAQPLGGAPRGEAAACTLSLLGPMALTTPDGRSVLPGGARGRAVLALLATAPGLRRPRRLIASQLWSNIPLRQALARLRDVLHDLRHGLDVAGSAILDADANGLWLRPGSVVVRLPATDAGPLLPELLGLDPQFDLWLGRAGRFAPDADAPAAPARPAPDAASRPATEATSRLPGQARLGLRRLTSLAGPAAGHLDTVAMDAITAALSPIRWISVRPDSPAADVDYLLGGHVRTAGDSVQAIFRLTDARDGALVWAGLISAPPREAGVATQGGPGEAVFELAAMTSARIEHELLLWEAERATRAPGAARPADLVLRALVDLHRLERERFMRAGKQLAAAARGDPDLAAAQAWLAFWHVLAVGQGWADSDREALRQAGEAAERAILLDPRDAQGLAVAGHVRSYLHHQVPEGLALCRRALAFNPNLPLAWGFAGMSLAYAGALDEARAHLRRALCLLPQNPHAFFPEAGLATVEMLRGDFVASVEIGRSVLQLHPRFTAALRAQIAAFGHLGRVEEARPLILSLLDLDPGFTLARFRRASPYVNRAQLEHFLRGMRQAGLN